MTSSVRNLACSAHTTIDFTIRWLTRRLILDLTRGLGISRSAASDRAIARQGHGDQHRDCLPVTGENRSFGTVKGFLLMPRFLSDGA